MYTLTYAELLALKPCNLNKAVNHFGGAKAWGNRRIGIKEAREAGVRLNDMIWLASRIGETDAEAERRLRHWMCDAAEHVLHIFERQYPDDKRPREAIRVARLFAEGKATAKELASAREAAGYAARTARTAREAGAAWAAWRAAARTAREAGAAWRSWAAWAAARTAHKAQEQYQYDRLVYWFSETDPQPALMEVTHV